MYIPYEKVGIIYKCRTYLHFDLYIITSFLTSLYFDMELTKGNSAEIVKLNKKSLSAKMSVQTTNTILPELSTIDRMAGDRIVR